MTEHLTDPLDVAARNAQLLNESGLAAHRKKCAPKQVRNEDGSWPHPDCTLCGEPIDPLRLEAIGSDICIDCAELQELKLKK